MLVQPSSRQGSREFREDSKERVKENTTRRSPRGSPRNSLSLTPQNSQDLANYLRREGPGRRSKRVSKKDVARGDLKADDGVELNSECSNEKYEIGLSRAMSIATLDSDMEEPSSISYLDNVLRYEFQRGAEERRGSDPRCNINASDTRTLLRSPSWRSLAQAEADEMSPTVWTADGLEKQPAAADREKGPIQQFCEDLQNKRAWTAAYVFFTAYALFSIDIDASAGDKSSRVGIAVCTTFVAVAFLVELIVHGLGKEGYIYSAFFILDLVAFLSLIPDTIIVQLANDDNSFVAGRSSRLTRMLRLFGRSARAARLNRFGRIARIAALMPKIQELQRYWVNNVEDADATRVLEKKIYRIFCFLDEDMDSYISKSSLIICRDKLFDLALIEKTKKPEWTSKLRMLANAASAATGSRGRQTTENSIGGQTPLGSSHPLNMSESTVQDAKPEPAPPTPSSAAPAKQETHLALAIPSETKSVASRPDKPFPDQVEYIEFRDSIMNEPPLYEWLKNSVVRQLKRGNNMQALRQRNAEYIGVKVAMAILLIILVLSYVELLTIDTSLSWGFQSLNNYLKMTGTPELNATIPDAIRRQVQTWGVQDGWARPSRPLLYLDLQRHVYCNSLRPEGPSCSLPLSEPMRWQPKRTLVEVDQDLEKSPYRQNDLLLLREPDFSQQDVDISASELENRTEAVALFLNRADTEASARDSIITTFGVLFLIIFGISLLTRDLNYLSKNLLKPLVELSDEVESITRLQLAATTNTHDENQPAVTSEIRLLRRRFDNMKTAIRSWGKYVPWPVVQLMMRKDAEANIEVSERKVTMFFSDIASFTTIVESMPPQKSLLLLSRYFQEMSKIVDQHGGIVVEFIGDAILCIYGAPVVNDKHPTVAVMAAVEMLVAMTGINQWLHRRGLPTISIRCGIHTGEVLVGNMGMQYRIKYGIVGDETSMPGRLEELNKTYGTQLLVSESTHSEMEIEGFVSRPIDFIRPSESAQERESQQIFEVWKSNKKPSKASLEEKATDMYAEGMQHYRHRRFSEAKDCFTTAGKAMHKLTGTQDTASALMLNRCASYLEMPPPENWDGVWDRSS